MNRPLVVLTVAGVACAEYEGVWTVVTDPEDARWLGEGSDTGLLVTPFDDARVVDESKERCCILFLNDSFKGTICDWMTADERVLGRFCWNSSRASFPSASSHTELFLCSVCCAFGCRVDVEEGG